MSESKDLLTQERKDSAIEDSTDLILRNGKIAVGKVHEHNRPLQEATKKKYINVATEWLKNGGSATEAYLKIYPNCQRTTAAARGSEVLGHPEIQEFLAECWKRVATQENIGPEFIFRELLNAAKVNMVDYLPEPGSNLGPVEHLKALPKNIQRRLRAVDFTEATVPTQYGMGHQSSLKLKGLDPQRAIETLSKALGIFAEAEKRPDRFNHADMIEKGVARLHALGTLDTAKLYDEEGKLLDSD